MSEDIDEHNEDEENGSRLHIDAGLSALAKLLDALDIGERIDRAGTIDSGRGLNDASRSIEYRYSIGTGLDRPDVPPPSRDASPASRPPPRRRREWQREGRPHTKRNPGSTTDRTLPEKQVTSVQRDDSGTTLVADLAEPTAEDVAVGLDRERSEVVVAVNGTVKERIPIDGDDLHIEYATYNNGVLEVRFEASDSETTDDETTGVDSDG